MAGSFVLKPYERRREPGPFRRFMFFAAIIGLAAFYGLLASVLPMQLLFIPLVPILILVALILWMMPDVGGLQIERMQTLMWWFIGLGILWPNYVAFDLPGRAAYARDDFFVSPTNAQALAAGFVGLGYDIISGGTDNHLMLIDLRSKGLSGKLAENTLVRADITLNKNMVPFDDKSPFVTSGIRIGSAAVTTRGLNEADMHRIVELIDETLTHHDNDTRIGQVRQQVNAWLQDYPLFA